MEFSTVLRILRISWLAILVFIFLGAAGGVGWSYTQPKIYTATASAIITAGVSPDIGSALSSDNYAKSRVKSYLNIASSRTVAQYAIDELKINASPQILVGQVGVTNPIDTAVLIVSAKARSPKAAADLAEAWILGMTKAVDEIEAGGAILPPAGTTNNLIDGGTSGDTSTSIVRLQTLDTAVEPTSPTSPNRPLALGIGALIGFAIGLVIAIVRFSVDLRIHSDDTIEKDFGKPLVGVVPEVPSVPTQVSLEKVSNSNKKLTAKQRTQIRSFNEAVNKLRTNLQFMNIDNPPRIMVVTSSLPGEGKSTLTQALALAIAATGQKVVAIDADLRKPALLQKFGLVGGAGLTDVLIGRASLNDVLQPWGKNGRLKVLGPGAIPPNPSELLGSEAMNNLIHEIALESIVLIDSPPLLPVTDASVLAARTDGAIVVVRAGRTTSIQLAQAMQNLERASADALGLVLNRVPFRGKRGGYYGYQYTGEYISESDKARDDSYLENSLQRRRKV